MLVTFTDVPTASTGCLECTGHRLVYHATASLAEMYSQMQGIKCLQTGQIVAAIS